MELNDLVFITLTKAGADILNKENKKMREEVKSKYFPKTPDVVDRIYPTNYEEGQVLSERLWIIFSWFGLYSFLGQDLPFTNLRQVTN